MDIPKRRGRPRKSVLDRKETGIAFLDLVRPSPLPLLLDIPAPPCGICQYHALVGEAQRLLRIVHENNLKVFRRYRGGGKRELVPDLMAPWLDKTQPYPFNLDPDAPGRCVPTGYRNPWEIEVEASELGVKGEAIEWEAEGVRYGVEFDTDSAGRRILRDTTRVYVQNEKEAARHVTLVEFAKKLPLQSLDLTKKASPPSFASQAEEEEYYKSAMRRYEEAAAGAGDSMDQVVQELSALARAHAASGFSGDEEVARARQGWLPAATFAEYIKGQRGRVTKRTFESRDLHDRMVAVRLVKEAQAGDPSARKVVLSACRPVIEEVAAEFREWAKRHRNAEFPAEYVQSVAKDIGRALILGTSPRDLLGLFEKLRKEKIRKRGEPNVSLPLNRTLDRLLRYRVELEVYMTSWAAIETAVRIHESHGAKVADQERAKLYKRMGATLSMLQQAFDPFTWLNDQRVFDLTSKAARVALSRAYQKAEGEEGPARIAKALEEIPRRDAIRYVIRFDDAYDPALGVPLTGYIKKFLKRRLGDWLRAEFPPLSKKLSLVDAEKSENIFVRRASGRKTAESNYQ